MAHRRPSYLALGLAVGAVLAGCAPTPPGDNAGPTTASTTPVVVSSGSPSLSAPLADGDSPVAPTPELLAAAAWRCQQVQSHIPDLDSQGDLFTEVLDTFGAGRTATTRILAGQNDRYNAALAAETTNRCGDDRWIYWREATAGWTHLAWVPPDNLLEAELQLVPRSPEDPGGDAATPEITVQIDYGPGRSAAPLTTMALVPSVEQAALADLSAPAEGGSLPRGSMAVAAVQLTAPTGAKGHVPLTVIVTGRDDVGNTVEVSYPYSLWLSPYEADANDLSIPEQTFVVAAEGRVRIPVVVGDTSTVVTNILAPPGMTVLAKRDGRLEPLALEPYSWTHIDLWVDLDEIEPGTHRIPISFTVTEPSGVPSVFSLHATIVVPA